LVDEGVVTVRSKTVGCVGLLAFFPGDLADFSWRFSGRIWFGPAVAVRAVGDRVIGPIGWSGVGGWQGHGLVVDGGGKGHRSKADWNVWKSLVDVLVPLVLAEFVDPRFTRT